VKTHTIKILPQKVRTIAKSGDNLLSVLQRCGMALEAVCGGQGSCGRCVVRLVDGECDGSGSHLLSQEMKQKHFILACQASVTQDITIEIPRSTHKEHGIDYSTRIDLKTEISAPPKLSPLSRLIELDIPEPTREKGMSDHDRLLSQLSLKNIHCSLPVLRDLPDILRQKHGCATATVVEHEGGSRIISLRPGKKTPKNLGLACDVGTTTVALQMVDLNSGDILDTVSSYNEQIDCGADVISRIVYSQKQDHLHELNQRIVSTINRLVEQLTSKHDIPTDEIHSGVFSGNTTMIHLLLGINPKYIREDPYTPAVKQIPQYLAEEVGVGIHPNGILYFTPSVGSYLGGDITSGLLYVDAMRERHGVDLFIDIGTNGEMVISGEDWMIGCACSAGPAFEGVGIRCGMRAAEGAIDSVEIHHGGMEFTCRIMGDGKPKGICGSGLIELVAGLFLNRVVGRDGKFNEDLSLPALQMMGKDRVFTLYQGNQTVHGEPVYICEQDIMNIMRAKAAIYSACALLLKNIGLQYTDIENIYVGGGFGHTLNIEKAIAMGMFPDISPERFIYLGNTSLLGAYLSLLYSEHRQRIQDISTSITYVDLSSESNYMDQYSAALFLPHTDDSLFPSVKPLI